MGADAALLAMISLASRVLGALLFGTALWSKLRHFDEFATIVARYLVAAPLAGRIAGGLVVMLEAAVVVLLLVPQGAVLGAMLAIVLLLLFAAAMGMALLRGERELDCGCMQSALRQRVRPALILRNLLLAACMVPLLSPGQLALTGVMPVMNGLAAGLVLFVLNLAFGAFVALDDSFAELKRRYG